MAKTKLTTPLILQSKFLCFSLLYFFASIFLALYISLNPTKCFFRSSPFNPIQSPLFPYPPYGEHKYAIPTHRSSCSSPLYSSDYWLVVKEIQDLCRNSTAFYKKLRYLNGKSENFGGNLSIKKRLSYLDH